jgi:Prophage CP4-57 regulatory protein (AlpA)
MKKKEQKQKEKFATMKLEDMLVKDAPAPIEERVYTLVALQAEFSKRGCVPYTRSRIWQLEKLGQFPERVKLGQESTAESDGSKARLTLGSKNGSRQGLRTDGGHSKSERGATPLRFAVLRNELQRHAVIAPALAGGRGAVVEDVAVVAAAADAVVFGAR